MQTCVKITIDLEQVCLLTTDHGAIALWLAGLLFFKKYNFVSLPLPNWCELRFTDMEISFQFEVI